MQKESCYFCDIANPELQAALLGETEYFWIISDLQPLAAGHLLLVSKEHRTCAGDFSDEEQESLEILIANCRTLLEAEYGATIWFEHGVLGQTIHHAHIHLVPYSGGVKAIIPEGDEVLSLIDDSKELQWIYKETGGYLALGMGELLYLVDDALAYPRFFRDRVAKALGAPERADWEEAMKDSKLAKEFADEVAHLRTVWTQGTTQEDPSLQ